MLLTLNDADGVRFPVNVPLIKLLAPTATLSNVSVAYPAGKSLVTVMVYVFVVVPSCAVTNTSIVLLPTFKLNEPDGLPLVTEA